MILKTASPKNMYALVRYRTYTVGSRFHNNGSETPEHKGWQTIQKDNIGKKIVLEQVDPMHRERRYGTYKALDHDIFSLFFNQCCGPGMFFPYPGFDFFLSRIRVFSIPDPHQFKYFNPKMVSKL